MLFIRPWWCLTSPPALFLLNTHYYKGTWKPVWNRCCRFGKSSLKTTKIKDRITADYIKCCWDIKTKPAEFFSFGSVCCSSARLQSFLKIGDMRGFKKLFFLAQGSSAPPNLGQQRCQSDALPVLLGSGRKILFNVSTITFPGVIYSGMLMCLESTGPHGLWHRLHWAFQSSFPSGQHELFGAAAICLNNTDWCCRNPSMQ